jgi:hypothetical protein
MDERQLYPVYTDEQLVQRARDLDRRLMQEVEGFAPRTRREMARNLIRIYEILNQRSYNQPQDDRAFEDRSEAEQDQIMGGLEGPGAGEDPMGGLIESTPPFGNIDAWTAIANREVPDIPQPPRPRRQPTPPPLPPSLPPSGPAPNPMEPTPEQRARAYQQRRDRLIRNIGPSPNLPPPGYGESGRYDQMIYASDMNGYVQAWREIIGSGQARDQSYYEPARRSGRARAVREWQSLLDGPRWELEEFGRHSEEFLRDLERNQRMIQRRLESNQ